MTHRGYWMTNRYPCHFPAAFALTLVAALFMAAPAAAQEGSVGGVVVEEDTGQPLAGVQITVEGTRLGTMTNQDGRFVITGVSGDQVRLRLTLLGYGTATPTVQVGDLGLRLALSPSAIELDRIVVTGTAGEQSKRALGNSLATLNAEEIVEVAPVSTLQEMLNGRAAGVAIINTTGMLGGGSRVRIRGASSFSLSNEPLVYVDGVRVNSDQSTGPANQAFGSRSISRWNDFNPEDIESIEIIKGPAAATLYGTEASNGVIQIITKRGRPGQPRIDVSVKQGAVWFPDISDRLWTNWFPVDGEMQSLDVSTLTREDGSDVWQTGNIQQYDIGLGGGGEDIRYYIAANLQNSTGIERENRVRNGGGRLNLTATPGSDWEVSGNLNYTTGRTDLPLEAGGGGATWSTYFARPDRVDTPRRGFWSGTPEAYEALWDIWQDLERTSVGLTVNHRPADWFSQRLTVGQDITREQDNELMHHDTRWLFFFSFSDRGYKEVREHNAAFTTGDYNATVRLPLRDGLESQTSFGAQMYRRFEEIVYSYGEAFPVPGLTSVAATTQGHTTFETSEENVTVGVYAQEQLAWQDRLFLTAALRADDNSAFGQNFDLVYYPKVSAAWVVSEEPFWTFGPVGTLKLRAAYGESGQQPTAFAAVRTFAPVTGPRDFGTVTPQNLGNPDLGPERGKEVELGFDAGLFDERLGVEFTFYNQRTTDAILLREIAPSTGFSGTQFVNAGEIRNRGVELLLNAEAFRTDQHGLDLSFNIASNDNEVISLGDVTDDDFISLGGYIRHQIGHPVGSWFSRRVVSADLNDAGVAVNILCDDGQGGAIECADAPEIFLGRTVPKVEGGFGATATLFRSFRLFAQLDFKSGFTKLDGNLRVRCLFFAECRENWFPEEFDPVRIAEIQSAGTFGDVIIDDADFTKLREVSLAYSVPASWANRFGASRASISVAGRNLKTWTDFSGLEPESTFNSGSRGGNHHLWEQNVLPQLAQFVATVNLSF